MKRSRRLLRIALGLLGLGLVLWAAQRAGLLGHDPASLGRELTWELIDRRIAEEFPDVEGLDVSTLERRLDSGEPPPLLLDVRTEAEYAVSHLPGAQRVEPGTIPALPQDLPRDAPIVTYCSVGYRSAALAHRLEEQGYTNVRNLEGSLFAWANAGLPLEGEGKPVREVHPYDAFWGQLLHEELRAPLP